MRIELSSSFVDDQRAALKFYTDDVEAEHARLTEAGSPSPNRRAI